MSILTVKDLHVQVEDKEILKGIDLEVKEGETHALMGPNGNGKSTLLAAIMGNPKYTVTAGEILLDGQDVLAMEVDERSKAGLFLGMQYPSEISGVTNSDFLRTRHQRAQRDADPAVSVHPQDGKDHQRAADERGSGPPFPQ